MNIDISIFYEEATEQLDIFRNILDNISYDYLEDIKEAFRNIHTIKGSADIFGFADIVSFAHKSEDLLDEIRADKIIFDDELKELFLNIADMLETMAQRKVNNTSLDTYESELLNTLTNSLTYHLKEDSSKRKKLIPKEVNPVIQEEPKEDKKTILIVDDSSMIRSVTQNVALEKGLKVITANDGAQGIEKAKANKIDLIFSDVNMPVMDGLTMVENIKKLPELSFVPVVMLTTEKKEELKQKGKKLGVKAWMVKPFNKEKFSMVLEKILF
jgi:two-component system chemotaxis response regulator CheY